MKDSRKRIQKIFTFISVGIFILSLTQDCVCAAGNSCYKSWFAFAFGWFSIASRNLMIISWLANPLLIFSWILTLINSNRIAWFTSIGSTLLCLSFLLFDSIVVNEAGGISEITGYRPGYYLWLASAVIILTGNSLLLLKDKGQCQEVDKTKE